MISTGSFYKKYVQLDEQTYMFEQTELSVVQERLSQTSGFKLHCRIKQPRHTIII